MPAEIIGRALYALAGLVAGVLICLIFQQQTTPAPGVVTVAAPAKVLTKVEKVMVPCEQVQVYKPAAKGKVGLPAAIQANPDSHVLAATEVKAALRDTRISTVIDTKTGISDTYAEVLPLPWLRPESRGEVGLALGIDETGERRVRLSGNYDLLQIKAAHLGIVGSLDDQGRSFAGVGVRIRW